jgi:hypothetical protein
MKRLKTTTALKNILKGMKLINEHTITFSDTRKDGYVGIKVCGLKDLSEGNKDKIVKEMVDLGFVFKSIKQSQVRQVPFNYFEGTRFTFSKLNMPL